MLKHVHIVKKNSVTKRLVCFCVSVRAHICVYWMFCIVRQVRRHLLCVTDREPRTRSSQLCVPTDKGCMWKRNVPPHQVRSPFEYLDTPSSSPCLSKPLVSNTFFPLNLFYHYVRPYMIPFTSPLPPVLSSLPSAQSHHTGSLFLANLSLIHYWGLFFFLESQNKEGERIFWIFNAPYEKCIISHFSTIWTGKLLAGHKAPSHEMMRDMVKDRGTAR